MMQALIEQKHTELLNAIAAAREQQQQEIAALRARMQELEAELRRPAEQHNAPPMTLGRAVIESEQVKALVGQPWVSRQVSVELKTTIVSGTLPPKERVPEIPPIPSRPLRVRDLFTRVPTSASAVEFVRESSFTNAASPVAEGSAKGESTIGLTLVTCPVRTIAHFVPASRQVLDDLPGLQALIDNSLTRGLLDIEDWEILFGDGTGQHLDGIYHQASAYAGTYEPSGANRIDKLTAAMAEVESRNYVVDSIILNPVDWRRIVMLRGDAGYLVGGPITAPAQAIWGVRIALTTAMTPGSFLVGQAEGNVFIYDRQEVRIVISSEHADFFVKNLVAIRAEERIALAVMRPDAWTAGTF
jgi:HK97 family phage major capsid protein